MRNMSGVTRRQMLASLPALALAPRAFAADPPIRVRALNHFGLAVSDPKRSIDFYQGLFGAPVQARVGTTTILRLGGGPQFISIAPLDARAAPIITHYCLGVEGFNLDRIVASLAAHGVAKADAVGPMKANVAMRDGTPDLLFGDPDGIVCQLQDGSYCGGSGPLGNVCKAPEPSPKKGLIALRDISHLTIFSTDAQRSNAFYQDLFGLSIRSYQGPTAPTLAVGPTVEFLMFAGGGPARGAAPSRPASINHACMSMDAFNPDQVLKTLETYGITPRGEATGPVGPMKSYVTMRMENRGGAPGGTPELYFTDPDGLLMQLQDASYCGGSGFLGNVCR
jgi:catechol 2,3-dioxygenase-like lactoylglutathione lyase family enzyme